MPSHPLDRTLQPAPSSRHPGGQSLTAEQIAEDLRGLIGSLVAQGRTLDELPSSRALADRWACPLSAAIQWRHLALWGEL